MLEYGIYQYFYVSLVILSFDNTFNKIFCIKFFLQHNALSKIVIYNKKR